LTRLSRSFKAERADERIEIIDDALIEAIELRPLLLVDPSICSKGAENAGGQWRIDAFEQLQEDKADRVSLRKQSITTGVGKLGDEPFGPEFCKVVAQRAKGVAFGGAAEHGEHSRVEFRGGEGVAAGVLSPPYFPFFSLWPLV